MHPSLTEEFHKVLWIICQYISHCWLFYREMFVQGPDIRTGRYMEGWLWLWVWVYWCFPGTIHMYRKVGAVGNTSVIEQGQ